MVGAGWSGIGGIGFMSACPNFITLYFNTYIRIKKACVRMPPLPNLLHKQALENVVYIGEADNLLVLAENGK